jgi:catechol 2,3-dioxygenase-like lactoylglutathione lyase family enzyme
MSSAELAGLTLEHSTRRKTMSASTSTALNLTRVGRVCVSVSDTDRALEFYVGTLGFEKVVDVPMGPDARWVELRLRGGETTVALAPPPPGTQAGGSDSGIILDTTDIEADHATLRGLGADVDEEISRMGDPVPPMFWVRDPDGNSLIVVQPDEQR